MALPSDSPYNQFVGYFWERDDVDRTAKLVTLLCFLCFTLGLVACTSSDQGAQQPSETQTSNSTSSKAPEKSAPQEQEGGNTEASTTAPSSANTGTISGRVTDKDTGEPISDTYITVGWEDSQLAAITDGDGRYTVPNVPAGELAPVLGFHPNGYRYHNSSYDDDLNIRLKPGETYTYDFSLPMLDSEGQPEVSEPSISSGTAAPGETVTFKLNAGGGKGGLSKEVFAASPKLGRLVLLKPTDGENEYSAEFTIPADTQPGEYEFAFFTASKECYVNGEFPMRTLRVT